MGAHIHGRYRLGARIEAAGFGEWWHAHDEEKDEAVRVAIVDARRAPAAAVTAFRDVSQKAARLRHPGLEAIVHHGDNEKGHPFCVVRAGDAKSLDAVLAGGGLNAHALLRTATTVLDALGSVHEAGLVHGDIEPGRIFVAGDEPARLAGLVLNHAAARAGHGNFPVSSALERSLRFMSPEQARGGGPSVDGDLYGLGATLYFALTGGNPRAAGDEPVTRQRIAFEAPVPIGSRRADLPAALAKVIDQSVADEPGDRFASAGEMRQAITRALLSAPTVAKLVTRAPKPSMPAPPGAAVALPPIPGAPPAPPVSTADLDEETAELDLDAIEEMVSDEVSLDDGPPGSDEVTTATGVRTQWALGAPSPATQVKAAKARHSGADLIEAHPDREDIRAGRFPEHKPLSLTNPSGKSSKPPPPPAPAPEPEPEPEVAAPATAAAPAPPAKPVPRWLPLAAVLLLVVGFGVAALATHTIMKSPEAPETPSSTLASGAEASTAVAASTGTVGAPVPSTRTIADAGAPEDAGIDAGQDAGQDAGSDAGTDAGTVVAEPTTPPSEMRPPRRVSADRPAARMRPASTSAMMRPATMMSTMRPRSRALATNPGF